VGQVALLSGVPVVRIRLHTLSDYKIKRSSTQHEVKGVTAALSHFPIRNPACS